MCNRLTFVAVGHPVDECSRYQEGCVFALVKKGIAVFEVFFGEGILPCIPCGGDTKVEQTDIFQFSFKNRFHETSGLFLPMQLLPQFNDGLKRLHDIGFDPDADCLGINLECLGGVGFLNEFGEAAPRLATRGVEILFKCRGIQLFGELPPPILDGIGQRGRGG